MLEGLTGWNLVLWQHLDTLLVMLVLLLPPPPPLLLFIGVELLVVVVQDDDDDEVLVTEVQVGFVSFRPQLSSSDSAAESEPTGDPLKL